MFPEVEILFTASGAADLLHKLESLKPDVLLLDINMPEMNGIEAARKVKELYPDIRIIMLTVFDEEEKVFDSILSGASGYLLKDEKPSKIITALEEAMDGGAPMSPVIASKALKLIRSISGSTLEEQPADHLAGRIEAGNDLAVGVDDAGHGVDLHSAECEGDAAGERD